MLLGSDRFILVIVRSGRFLWGVVVGNFMVWLMVVDKCLVVVVGLFWLVVGGGGFILGFARWWWVFLGSGVCLWAFFGWWWWVVGWFIIAISTHINFCVPRINFNFVCINITGGSSFVLKSQFCIFATHYRNHALTTFRRKRDE